jgi:hypothetical protein
MKDNTPPPPPTDPLPPREPLQKPTRDDGTPLSAPPPPPKAPEIKKIKKKELHLPKTTLPASYFDSNGHARPYSLLDPMNMTDSFNNDQFHYRN